MKKSMLGLALVSLSALSGAQENVQLFPKVEFETSQGKFTLELDARRAPITVSNFLNYVRNGHYDGTVFHRVISGFMVQGGGYDAKLAERPTANPIPNESGNGLSNGRGTIAMARTGNPHSATAQFFINVADNKRLDPNKVGYRGTWGYTVFGQVIEGMDVVDTIVNSRTGPQGPFQSDVPVVPVVIKKASRYTFE